MKIWKRITQLVASLVVAMGAGALGSLATTPNIPTWYAELAKPPLLPPNEAFGPVWSILYVFMGIALFLVWIAKKKQAGVVYIAFFTQLILNVLWSVAFFTLHLPWLGVIIIIGLIASIIWTMIEFKKHSDLAFWLLVPYLAWVGFATYLTVGVATLN
ncbi:tryptophan-rich sensory protein [Candidatus Saccharibacteria bacterium TM7i]|nr:tryptophan-rich sensory protein [Candidatus Saccharibacteria bacterium TM7i]